MKPYYDHAGITIYHGDCRDILPLLPKVDLVLTDPPWGLGELSGTTSRERNRNDYRAQFQDTEEYVREVIVPAFTQAMAISSGRALVTCGCRCMWFYPRPRAIGGFYQPAAVGMSPWGFAAYNPVLFYGKDPRDGKGQNAVMTKLNAPASDDRHPCSKPEQAMRWLVSKGSLEGETILDPFMGSGTTLRAAKDLGRKAIGIEVEEKYCEIAAKRMSQEVLDFSE